jgi:hypothetical protein
MVGYLEWWSDEKHSGFIVTRVEVNGGWRLDRYYLAERSIIFTAVESIKTGNYVRFLPGPCPTNVAGAKPLKPAAFAAEIYGTQACALAADLAGTGVCKIGGQS